MAPKEWDDESSGESSSEESAGGPAAVQVRRKFDDEEADDDDVLESWDAAEDSEVEREKAKKAAEAKAKADAEAAASKLSKAQRIALRQQRRKELGEEDDSEEEEDEAARRLRLRQTEKESDLKHAEDLLGDIGVPAARKAVSKGAAVSLDGKDPTKTIDISTIPLFNPTNKAQWDLLRETLVPILAANPKRAGYITFLEELVKGLAQDLPSEQVKKISSRLTALSNEKMKAEKEKKGVKKTKASKTKTSLVATRADVPDTNTYDEGGFGDDDFM
ncbi:hypothetical protein RB594_005537 [Gaeumannomyces avenae]